MSKEFKLPSIKADGLGILQEFFCQKNLNLPRQVTFLILCLFQLWLGHNLTLPYPRIKQAQNMKFRQFLVESLDTLRYPLKKHDLLFVLYLWQNSYQICLLYFFYLWQNTYTYQICRLCFSYLWQNSNQNWLGRRGHTMIAGANPLSKVLPPPLDIIRLLS